MQVFTKEEIEEMTLQAALFHLLVERDSGSLTSSASLLVSALCKLAEEVRNFKQCLNPDNYLPVKGIEPQMSQEEKILQNNKIYLLEQIICRLDTIIKRIEENNHV